MKKGIINTGIYYLSGFLLTVVSYWVFDHSYAHGPSAYHLVALFTILGGVLWTIIVTFQFLVGKRSIKRQGIILSNITVLAILSLSFYVAVIRPETSGVEQEPVDKLETEVRGDTTIISTGGRIVYVKVRDSVYLDFLDSIE